MTAPETGWCVPNAMRFLTIPMLLLGLLLPPALAGLVAAMFDSPAAAAYCSALAMAGALPLAWLAGLAGGLVARSLVQLVFTIPILLVLTLLLLPAFDPEGLTGDVALIAARLNVIAAGALFGRLARAGVPAGRRNARSI